MQSKTEEISVLKIPANDKNPSKLFSVVIPTFQRLDLLIETINSIYASPFIGEILVVNDDPKSTIVLEKDKIKVFNSERKLGESGAVNLGWQVAKFPFVIIISDDDPQTSELFYEIAKVIRCSPNGIVYFPNSVERNAKKIIFTSKVEEFSTENFYGLLRSPCLAGVAINKKVLKFLQINELRNTGVNYPSDLLQWLELSKYGEFIPVKAGFSYWWRHTQQMSNYLGKLSRSRDYFYNVSDWFGANLDYVKKTTFWAVYFRSMQILGFSLLSRKGTRLACRCALETVKFHKALGFSFKETLLLLCLTLTRFLKLKKRS